MTPNQRNRPAAYAGSALGVLLVVVAAVYGPSPEAFLPAAPYYAAACIACLFGLVYGVGARRRAFPGRPEDAWRAGLTARVAALTGWALAALALLNIWACGAGRPPAVLPLSYALVAVAAWVGDQAVAMSDRRDQEGGALPLRPWGQPRSRRSFFWLCVVYPLGLLPAAGAALSAHSARYPTAFYPPALALLTIALVFLAVMALVRQRYRRLPTTPRSAAVYPAAAVLLALSGAVALTSAVSLYIYSISAGSVVFGAVAARGLLAAGAPGQR